MFMFIKFKLIKSHHCAIHLQVAMFDLISMCGVRVPFATPTFSSHSHSHSHFVAVAAAISSLLSSAVFAQLQNEVILLIVKKMISVREIPISNGKINLSLSADWQNCFMCFFLRIAHRNRKKARYDKLY